MHSDVYNFTFVLNDFLICELIILPLMLPFKICEMQLSILSLSTCGLKCILYSREYIKSS